METRQGVSQFLLIVSERQHRPHSLYFTGTDCVHTEGDLRGREEPHFDRSPVRARDGSRTPIALGIRSVRLTIAEVTARALFDCRNGDIEAACIWALCHLYKRTSGYSYASLNAGSLELNSFANLLRALFHRHLREHSTHAHQLAPAATSNASTISTLAATNAISRSTTEVPESELENEPARPLDGCVHKVLTSFISNLKRDACTRDRLEPHRLESAVYMTTYEHLGTLCPVPYL